MTLQDGQTEGFTLVDPLEDLFGWHGSIAIRGPHQPLLTIVELDSDVDVVGTSESGAVEWNVDRTGMAGSESFGSSLDGVTIETFQAVI